MNRRNKILKGFGIDPDDDHDWRSEWIDMPEYKQEDHSAMARVMVNFRTLADIAQFNEATGLNVTTKTKGVFYPQPESSKIVYVKD
jgi:hypothetical protein